MTVIHTYSDDVRRFLNDVLVALSESWDPPRVDHRVTGAVHVAEAVRLQMDNDGVIVQTNNVISLS
jgi:hypothetical protein